MTPNGPLKCPEKVSHFLPGRDNGTPLVPNFLPAFPNKTAAGLSKEWGPSQNFLPEHGFHRAPA